MEQHRVGRREVGRGTWAIHDVVRRTGVTSRMLRHYDAVGLLPATSTGPGGVRQYDDAALVRLQRILLLRGLGLGLGAIAEALAGGSAPAAEAAHLRSHLELLELERDTLERRIAAVRRTIAAREEGTAMTEEMFDGFDHAQYEEEVVRRWGRAAWDAPNAWWEAKSPEARADVRSTVAELNAAWLAAAQADEAADGELAQELAARHVAWLRSVPGTPAASGDPEATAAYLLGLGELYVSDERFRVNYSDPVQGVDSGPELVRDALATWVERHLTPPSRPDPRDVPR